MGELQQYERLMSNTTSVPTPLNPAKEKKGQIKPKCVAKSGNRHRRLKAEEYTAELLIEVEKLAALQFFVDQIAISLRIDNEKFRKAIKAGGNPLSDAFDRGRITAEAEVRREVLA